MSNDAPRPLSPKALECGNLLPLCGRSGLVRVAGAAVKPPAEHPARGSKLPPSAKRGQVRAVQSSRRSRNTAAHRESFGLADARHSDTPSCVKANPAGLPRQRLLLACLSAATGLGTAVTARSGSIHFDGSLGSAGALNGPNFLIPADRGKQVGGNLFHSFGDFTLLKDDVATFQGPSSVRNILARVTGGSASSIDGTLRSEISGANLYFINPVGVMFGANAKLDISGRSPSPPRII